MKRFIFLAMTLITVNILPAQTVSGRLTVWSFTDDLELMIDNCLKPAHKEAQINYSLFRGMEQFPGRLDKALASDRVTPEYFTGRLDKTLASSQTPDVFTLESEFVRKYVESGLLLDLTEIYERNKSKLLVYPVEIGTYNGRVYAMSLDATPGAMFYRRSMAKKYLGTDDPAAVQAYFSNPVKLLETAKLLNEKSGGKCVVVSSAQDLFRPFLGGRKTPWVSNGKLNIDPIMEQYMDICKTLHNNRWEGRIRQWLEDWFKGMNDYLTDENGNRLEVFSYFLPTWGLHYVLKLNATETSGDWAMIPGPVPYFWGGLWLAAYKNTKNPEAALAMIEWLTTNDSFLEQWSKDTGVMVTNTNVINKIKNSYEEPYLGGQNHYAAFADIAKNVNGKLAQSTDEVIEDLFQKEVTAFVNGEKTKTQVLADFRRQVQRWLGF